MLRKHLTILNVLKNVEIGIEGSKSRTRALKVLTAMNNGVGLMKFHGGLGLGLVILQSS